jgi:1-pyrroline-5-carboxylate dehydrogenase
VLTVYVYDRFDKAIELCDKTTPYALTGSIFVQDEKVLEEASRKLKQSCGTLLSLLLLLLLLLLL